MILSKCKICKSNKATFISGNGKPSNGKKQLTKSQISKILKM